MFEPGALKFLAALAFAAIAAYGAYTFGGYLAGGIAFFVVAAMIMGV